MTQEDRKLLMQEICERIPYRTWFNFSYEDPYGRKSYSKRIIEGVSFPYYIEYCTLTGKEHLHIEKSEIQLYLFPMSSMTEEQKEEYRMVCELDTEILSKHPMDGSPFPALYNSQDWLNKNHFDYRGLIGKGLAIDATGKNIYQYYGFEN